MKTAEQTHTKKYCFKCHAMTWHKPAPWGGADLCEECERKEAEAKAR